LRNPDKEEELNLTKTQKDIKEALGALEAAYQAGTLTSKQMDEIVNSAKDMLTYTQDTRTQYFEMFNTARDGIDYWNE